MRLHLRAAALAAACASAAAITWPTFIADSMCLQRDAPLTLWGVDTPGATISASYLGKQYAASADSATGRFELAFPASPVQPAPFDIQVTSSAGGVSTLHDVLLCDVYLSSGQSNSELDVSSTVDQWDVINNSSQYGAMLRVFQVALLPEYANVTEPQVNLTASIPWSRAGPGSIRGLSAHAYYTALQALKANPSVPVGAVATNWGGVAIQVWMSPAALAKCPNAAMPPHPTQLLAQGRGMAALGASLLAAQPFHGIYPSIPSCLYNSMLAPLQSLPVKAWQWYQGEANAADPVGYQCLLPAMIEDWRASWAKAGSDPSAPFVFVQLAAWPAGDNGMIATMRNAMSKIPSLVPNTGMVVAADMSDPAGAMHPIHPPWKAEVGRRSWLWLSQGVSSPRVVNVSVDPWDASWGPFWHYGYGSGNVCGNGSGFQCAGIRLTFDQPVKVRNFFSPVAANVTVQGQDAYGFITGASSGFEVWESNCQTGNCTNVWWQPAALTEIRNGNEVVLNLTWIAYQSPPMDNLRYGWHDYPTALPLVSVADEVPVSPFNVSLLG